MKCPVCFERIPPCSCEEVEEGEDNGLLEKRKDV